MLEKDIENNIISFLREIGLDPVLKIKQDKLSRRTKNYEAGVLDILTWLPNGTGVAIEVKTKLGHPSESQLKMITRINNTQGVAFIARSVEQTFDQLRHWLPNSDKYLNIVNKWKQLEGSCSGLTKKS